jgi:hypothetical protein
MADPTTRSVPKAQERGAAAEQQEFIAESAPVEEVLAGEVVPQAIEPTLEEVEPTAEEEIPNTVALRDGTVNLDSVLYAPTERTAEDVTRGIPGGEAGRSMADLYDDLVRRGISAPDVVAMAELARRMGI